MTTLSRRQRWQGYVATWLVFVCATGYVLVPAGFLPVLREQFGIGAAAAGWVVSVIFLSMAVCGVPVGMVLDRIRNRTGVLAGAVVVVLAASWGWHAARSGDYWSLVASRVVGGAGVAVIWIAGVDVVEAISPPEREATAITVFATASPAGNALGLFGGATLAATVGWTSAFPVVAVSIAVFAALFFLWTSRWSDGVGESGGHETPTWSDFLAVLTDRVVLGVSVVSFAVFSVYLLLSNWLPSFVADRFALSLQQSGWFAALFPAIGVVSRSLSGYVSDRFFDRRERLLILASFSVTLPALVIVLFAPSVALVLSFVVVAGFFIQISMALLFVYVRRLVRPAVVGTAFSVLNAVGFFGAFSAPVVAGALIDRSGSYVTAFAYAGVLVVAGIAILASAPRAGPPTGDAAGDPTEA